MSKECVYSCLPSAVVFWPCEAFVLPESDSSSRRSSSLCLRTQDATSSSLLLFCPPPSGEWDLNSPSSRKLSLLQLEVLRVLERSVFIPGHCFKSNMFSVVLLLKWFLSSCCLFFRSRLVFFVNINIYIVLSKRQIKCTVLICHTAAVFSDTASFQ